MRRIGNVAVAALLFIAAIAAAERYAPAAGSLVRIEGSSTLHDWKMEGSTISGTLTTSPIEQWAGATPRSEASVSIPVSSIRSGQAKMDKLMAEALKSSANPIIRYELIDASLAQPGDVFVLDTRGRLSIAGVTRAIEMQITGTRNPNGLYILTGQLPIRMSDYGIKPPTAMMGTIKTGNDVKVSFRWIVEPAKEAAKS